MAEHQEVLNETLSAIAVKENLENYAIEIDSLNLKAENYSSALYKVTITSTNREPLRLFAKVATWSESLRSQLNVDELYNIETYFYTDIVATYERLQEKYCVPAVERFVFPKYYGSNSKYMQETVVMEDLAAKNYALYDRLKPTDYDYTSKAVEELAKLHALSFAYKHHYPELYEGISKKFDSIMTAYFIGIREVFRNTGSSVYDIVPENVRGRLEKFVDDNMTDEAFAKYYGPGKWNVLVHGDYRTSNIMYKCQSGKVTSLIPVDYQILHMGSPSTDLLYLIYSGTDQAFRRQHLNQLLDLYYGTLSRCLQQMDLDPDIVFSRKDFDEDYKDMQAYGLRTALFILPIVLVDTDVVPSLSDEDSNVDDFKVKLNERYVDRFLPILDEYIELGLL